MTDNGGIKCGLIFISNGLYSGTVLYHFCVCLQYEIKPGSKCALCGEVFPVFHEDEAFPCRICDKVFHKHCLDACGDLTDTDKFNIDLAKSNIGWSCPECVRTI